MGRVLRERSRQACHVVWPRIHVSNLLKFMRKEADGLGTFHRLVGDPTSTPSRKYFSMGYYVQHPSSLGFVHIKDGQDPSVLPEFETGFLKTYMTAPSFGVLSFR